METEHISIDTISSYKVLHARVIRSTIPRGKLKSIQFPQLPEGYYSITYKDIPGINSIDVFNETIPLLCEGEITYEGEPLAVLCGPEKRKVITLCKNTRIEYETDYSLLGFNTYTEDQVIAEKTFSKGSAEKIFTEAFQTVEGKYHIRSRTADFTSLQGAIASKNKDILEIEADTQWPFHLQKSIARVCKIPVKKVLVRIGKFSPTYDEKLLMPSIYASFAAVLALKSGRAVRFIPGREEIIEYGAKKPEIIIWRKSAVDEKGKILAEKVTINANLGAYPLFTDEILSQLIIGAAGSYTIPNLKITCRGIMTSEPPMNVFNGLGLSAGVFSVETHISRIAEIYQKNPAQWRLQYLPGGKTYLPTGGIEKDFNGRVLLGRVLEHSDFTRKHAAYEILRKNRKQGRLAKENLRGIGVSFGFAGNGPTIKREGKETYSVKVRLDTDDRVTIQSSANGANSSAIWKKAASIILGIDPASVIIKKGDTSTLPNSGPSYLSSDISIVTSLVEKCCHGIKKQRFHQALPIEVKRSYRAPGSRRWDPEKLKGMPFHSLSWGTAAAEIEIDPVFLRVVVRGVWMLVDCGRLYNRKSALISLEASILETLGWTLFKNDVTLPSITDNRFNSFQSHRLPYISAEIVENRKTITGGLSRLPDTLVPAALVSAISQATGIYLDTLPIVPDTLYKHMEEI